VTAAPRRRRHEARKTPPDTGVRVRIVVTDPVPGVAYRVQVGRDGLHPPAQEGVRAVTFEFALRVGNARDGAPNFLPPFAQGPAGGRFLYVCSGVRAGQAGSCWERRAKIPLAGIRASLLRTARATPAATLEARIDGRAKDGGPACATVPLLDGGWQLRRQ